MLSLIKFIDNFLNRITMYRLVLYFLILLLGLSFIYTLLGLLPFPPASLLFSTLFLVLISWLANRLFSIVFRAPTNIESVFITALILALIILPARSFSGYLFLFWAAVLSQASKYILAINKKFIFNPAAIAVVITSFVSRQSANWWVGNLYLAPVVIIGGLLIVRKLRHEDLVFYFLLITLVSVLFFSPGNYLTTINSLFLHSSLLFFAFIMLTEPLTTPPTHRLQAAYGLLTGFLFTPQLHLGSIYSTPELALVIGNVFSYLVSPKIKQVLFIKDKLLIAPDTYDFVFPLSQKVKYRPGQYMEFTLSHLHPDDRGNRRYYTLASSPTEDNLRIGVKFNHPSSTFKQAMLDLDSRTPVVVSQLAGDFTLPEDSQRKLVLIAGGIGITPYRSMLKYLLDKNQPRDIVLVYSNKTAAEIVYKDIIDQAVSQLNLKALYTLTDADHIPAGWPGLTGRVSADMLKKHIPDYPDRLFYISGPHALVTAAESQLHLLGVQSDHIKTDFFPGFV